MTLSVFSLHDEAGPWRLRGGGGSAHYADICNRYKIPRVDYYVFEKECVCVGEREIFRSQYSYFLVGQFQRFTRGSFLVGQVTHCASSSGSSFADFNVSPEVAF